VRKLSAEQPATYVAFDCLISANGNSLLQLPFEQRREALDALVGRTGETEAFTITPFTRDLRKAERWLRGAQDQTDGVVAKRLDLPYLPGERVMLKVKRMRTADCVVGGFRYERGRKVVGSLLLGLYDDEGLLHHVGFTSAIAAAEKPVLTKRLQKLITPPGFTGDAPGGPSRWSTERSAEWQPLKAKLVVEVRYDHISGDRFRHGTKLVRWRPDKAPRQCTFEQLEITCCHRAPFDRADCVRDCQCWSSFAGWHPADGLVFSWPSLQLAWDRSSCSSFLFLRELDGPEPGRHGRDQFRMH